MSRSPLIRALCELALASFDTVVRFAVFWKLLLIVAPAMGYAVDLEEEVKLVGVLVRDIGWLTTTGFFKT